MNLLETLNKKELDDYTYLKEYKPNQVIFYEQDYCDRIGIIIEGKAVIGTRINDDKEEIITTLYPNDLFGHYLIFSKQNQYLGTGYTINKTKIRYISKISLNKLFEVNKNFLNKYLELICDGSINLKNQVKLLSHKNISERIMYYFLTNNINNKIYLKSVTDLANILSLPRPSVSRELTNLIKENKIKKDGKEITIL